MFVKRNEKIISGGHLEDPSLAEWGRPKKNDFLYLQLWNLKVMTKLSFFELMAKLE